MSTKDDALIEAMMDAAFGRADLPSIVVAMMRKAMIDALAVARKAILEEAASKIDECVISERTNDLGGQDATFAKGRKYAASAIRALNEATP
jgi:2-methylcitrate dehydratase PrpD